MNGRAELKPAKKQARELRNQQNLKACQGGVAATDGRPGVIQHSLLGPLDQL